MPQKGSAGNSSVYLYTPGSSRDNVRPTPTQIVTEA